MTENCALTGFAALAACAAVAGTALAQSASVYPAKSVRVVVGFQAGGGVDMYARAPSANIFPTPSASPSSSTTSRALPAGREQ